MMKNASLFLCFVAFCLIFSGCTERTEKPELWIFTNASKLTSTLKLKPEPSSFLFLNSDGTYTSDLGSFEYGSWQKKQDTLLLINQRQSRQFLKFSASKEKLRLSPDGTALLNFESLPLLNPKDSLNPFSLENNRWRLKAAGPESDTSLAARLLNHARFWEIYFSWATANSLSRIDVRSTASPIKIYSNGFEIKPLNSLPQKWIRLFNDEKDCIRANRMLEDLVRNNKIVWTDTEDKFKMFTATFQQLQHALLQQYPSLRR